MIYVSDSHIIKLKIIIQFIPFTSLKHEQGTAAYMQAQWGVNNDNNYQGLVKLMWLYPKLNNDKLVKKKGNVETCSVLKILCR